ncbi:glycosyltransferase family 4 protein [Botryobacter ruber]|uniref:glycosyltransferase family 4 protein n=1 Tax=Botryobacter ruber TaxID=2171629 RepID=UPI000E0C9345|nr:glycosyltransferase family 1 protein [Botryobacter ruber]
MIRIGFDAKRAFNNTSGLGNYSRFVISSMVRQYPEQDYLLFTPAVSPVFEDFIHAAASVQVVTPGNGFRKKLASLWRVFGMDTVLKQQRVDIYHGLSNEMPYGLPPGPYKRIVTIHDLIFMRYPNLYNAVDRLIYKRKVTDACRQSDRIIAISEQTKADLQHYLQVDAAKIEVVYQDCDPVFHQRCTAQQLAFVQQKYKLPPTFILSVGTLEKRKNQLQLLQAWHSSGLSDVAAIVFVGRKTAYTDELRAFIQNQKLQDKVFFLPYIPFQELPAIYQLAHLFIYPSVFEGFGIPIVEALNSGVPVITSTGSCFSEAGGPESIYIPPGDAGALAAAMQRVFGDEALRQRMISSGFAHARQFRAERTAAQLQQVYQEVLGR